MEAVVLLELGLGVIHYPVVLVGLDYVLDFEHQVAHALLVLDFVEHFLLGVLDAVHFLLETF